MALPWTDAAPKCPPVHRLDPSRLGTASPYRSSDTRLWLCAATVTVPARHELARTDFAHDHSASTVTKRFNR